MAAVSIVTDADASVPERLRRELEILTAPLDAPVLAEAEPPVGLRRDQAPVAADAAVAACLRAAGCSETVVYVGADDGYGGGSALVREARAALAGREGTGALVSVPIAGALMGAGWAAVAAAVAARAGRETGEVIAEAQRVGSVARVLALLEHPQFAGLGGGLAAALRRARALVELRGREIEVLERPRGREAGLLALRERFAHEARAAEGYLRVAIHHAGAAPAAGAMQRWVDRELRPEESLLAPLTRHAATRLGPGLVGFAWYHDPRP